MLFRSKADALKQDLIMERKKANEELMKGFSPEEKILFRRWLMDIINME